jgi:C1A family cysteine protease
MPPIYDQGQLGSCTANSAAAIYDYERSLQGLKFLTPSRLFIYFWTRFIEGTVDTDSGGQIRDAIKAMRLYGVVAERRWPYVISRFTKHPSNTLVLAAKHDVVVKQYAVTQTEAGLKSALNAVPPRPINFGFTCYPDLESAETAKTGILPLPSPGQQSIGGHAVDVIGYKQINGQDYYEIRNSWGKKWGDHGHFWMPAAYILNPSLASDFWVVQAVSQSAA